MTMYKKEGRRHAAASPVPYGRILRRIPSMRMLLVDASFKSLPVRRQLSAYKNMKTAIVTVQRCNASRLFLFIFLIIAIQ
jgi:hypothetical protein